MIPDSWIPEKWIPKALRRDEHQRSLARLLLVGILGLEALIGAALFVRHRIAELSVPVVLTTVSAMVLLALAPWWLHRRQRVAPAAYLVIVIFLLVVTGTGILVGAAAAPVLTLLVLVPVLASFLVDSRAGAWATVLVVALIGGFAFFGQVEGEAAFLDPQEELRARLLMLALAVLFVGFFVVHAEIERHKTQRLLREKNELYLRLFAQSKDMVSLSTPSGSLLDVNQAGLDLFEFEHKEDFLATDVSSFYVDPQQRQQLLEKVSAKGYVRGYESRMITHRGRERVVQGTTTAVIDQRGEISHLLTIMRDVTEERQQQLDLERKNAELDRFARTVSHDLKGPLFTIRGILEVMFLVARRDEGKARQPGTKNASPECGDRALSTEQLEAVEKVIGIVDRLDGLLVDLLELARMDDTRDRFSRLNLGELCGQALENLGGQINETGAEFHVADDLPGVYGDRSMLVGLLQNLFENAMKFAVPGRVPQVTVEADAASRPPIIRVRDNGRGIPVEERERVFEIFARADKDTEGSGVGLAVVKKVVDIHGGQLWIDATAEVGTTFCFTLEADPTPATLSAH